MHKKFNQEQFWRTPLGVSFCGYFVLMGLVGALTPPDILSAYSWTKPFTDFMVSLVSQIDKVTVRGIDRINLQVLLGFSVLLVLRSANMSLIKNKLSNLQNINHRD